MASFQQRFQGKMSAMPKQGLLHSKEVHRSQEVMKIEDQNTKLPPKVPDSIQASNRKGEILKMKGQNVNEKSKRYLFQDASQSPLKLPHIKISKVADKTSHFFQYKKPQEQPTGAKKIYSADQSKQQIAKYDSDFESLQRKHLQYLNKIEQLYMLKHI